MSEQLLCTTRREFLTGSLAFLSSASTLPLFLGNRPRVLAGPLPPGRAKDDGGRILVLVQLAGGNDGLNTVIPYENDLYYKCRRQIAVQRKDVLPLENGLGLHPAASGLKELFDDGKLAIVQGVGYPNPNRNHFASTNIWHTADPRLKQHEGWLESAHGIAVLNEPPPALRGDESVPPALQHSEALSGRGHGGRLAQSLERVARLIAADLPTRVYYVSMGGFDTHTGQVGRHQRLMREFGSAMKSFIDTLQRDKLLERVLVVTFSEFGRRVQENAAGGTDHGEAGPMFLCGLGVRPGVHEQHPDLGKLHRGELAFGCDFRHVYAAVLRDWLGMKPEKVLGPGFAPLGLIAK